MKSFRIFGTLLLALFLADPGSAIECTGTYKLTRSENFDEYMIAVGVGYILRKLAAYASVTTEISKTGEDWEIKTSTSFKNTDIAFKLDQEFDEVTADGRTCKTIISMQGDNTLVQNQKCGKDAKVFDIIREFTDTGMKMILHEPTGHTATRYYTKKVVPTE